MSGEESSPDLTYPNLLTVTGKELAEGHTESRAFLAWVLRHYYRLDDLEVQDAICDGSDDKGIDGIYVDENEDRIDVFQSRIAKNPKKTLGDTQLKEFIGTLSQFDSPEGVEAIAVSTTNVELRGLIVSRELATLVRDGYTVRGVFVTNAKRDSNAQEILDRTPSVRLLDGPELQDSYVPADRPRSARGPFTFDVFGLDVATFPVGDGIQVTVASLAASDLVKLEGIAGGDLFEINVRQSLGRTKVNKDIAKSIGEPSEHKNFILYHNGITLICSVVDLDQPGKIVVDKYSVINGCQSLTALYDNRDDLSSELRILTRLVQIPDDHALIDKCPVSDFLRQL